MIPFRKEAFLLRNSNLQGNPLNVPRWGARTRQGDSLLGPGHGYGLTRQSIYQHLMDGHDFAANSASIHRFARRLTQGQPNLPQAVFLISVRCLQQAQKRSVTDVVISQQFRLSPLEYRPINHIIRRYRPNMTVSCVMGEQINRLAERVFGSMPWDTCCLE